MPFTRGNTCSSNKRKRGQSYLTQIKGTSAATAKLYQKALPVAAAKAVAAKAIPTLSPDRATRPATLPGVSTRPVPIIPDPIYQDLQDTPEIVCLLDPLHPPPKKPFGIHKYKGTGPAYQWFQDVQTLPPSRRTPTPTVNYNDTTEDDEEASRKRISRATGSIERTTRVTIHGLFIDLGAPDPREWDVCGGTIDVIKSRLPGFLSPDRRTIRKVLAGTWRMIAEDGDFAYDPFFREIGGGRTPKLEGKNRDDAARLLNKQMSPNMIAARMNKEAIEQGSPFRISGKAILRTLMDVDGAERAAIQKASQGNYDSDSPWAKSSLIEAQHFLMRIECGRLFLSRKLWLREKTRRARIRAGGKDTGAGLLDSTGEYDYFPPIWPNDGMGWLDENHKKLHYGTGVGLICEGSAQFRIPMLDGVVTPISEGGTLPPKVQVQRFKYPNENRMAHACALKREMVGKDAMRHITAAMIDPCDYSGCKLVSVSAWKQGVNKRIKYVKNLKKAGKEVEALNAAEADKKAANKNYRMKRFISNRGWKGIDMNAANPYIERAAILNKVKPLSERVTWEDVIKEGELAKIMCITDVMRHQMWALDDFYAGSTHEDDWSFYHDGLTLWFTPEALRLHPDAKEMYMTIKFESFEEEKKAEYDDLVDLTLEDFDAGENDSGGVESDGEGPTPAEVREEGSGIGREGERLQGEEEGLQNDMWGDWEREAFAEIE